MHAATEIISSNSHDDMRLGELETSILLAAYPNYFPDGWQSCDVAVADRRYLTLLGIDACATGGVIGNPLRANAEKGQKVLVISARPPNRSSHWSSAIDLAVPTVAATVR